MDGLICQVHGCKEFLLYHPDDTPYLYPQEDNPLLSRVDPYENDIGRWPRFISATPIVVNLQPGDILFNPGYWHSTKTLSTSITVISSFWHRYNWQALIVELQRVDGQSKKIKTAVIKSYLNLLKPYFIIKDRFSIK